MQTVGKLLLRTKSVMHEEHEGIDEFKSYEH